MPGWVRSATSAPPAAPVAQLDRAPDYESGGWRFESFRARQRSQLLEFHFISVLSSESRFVALKLKPDGRTVQDGPRRYVCRFHTPSATLPGRGLGSVPRIPGKTFGRPPVTPSTTKFSNAHKPLTVHRGFALRRVSYACGVQSSSRYQMVCF